MPAAVDPWNSLEVAKLIVGVLTPLSVVALGLYVNRRLKRLDLVNWSNQKLIEKRLGVYDTVAPLLNRLLCFYTWVGNWKEVTPPDVIRAKRELDLAFNVYRHLFENEVYESYQSFIHALFETYTAPGHDAKIRSYIRSVDGDRTTHASLAWNAAWASSFSDSQVVPKKEVREKYYRVMNALRDSLGVRE